MIVMIEPPKTVAAERLHERVTARAAEPEEPIRPELVERAKEVAEAHKRIMTLFAKKNGLPPPPDDPPESGDRKEKAPAEKEVVLDEEALEVQRAEVLLVAAEAALGIDDALGDADLEATPFSLDEIVNETKEMNHENENALNIDCNAHALDGADSDGVSAECGEALGVDFASPVDLNLDINIHAGFSR